MPVLLTFDIGKQVLFIPQKYTARFQALSSHLEAYVRTGQDNLASYFQHLKKYFESQPK